jgi:hypothetical protein
VGHSTGGLDVRQLIVDLSTPGHHVAFKRVYPEVVHQRFERLETLRSTIFDAIETAQFVSTPHYGSNLAHWACMVAPSLRLAAGGLHHAARFGGARGCAAKGRLIAHSPSLFGNDGFRSALGDALSKMLPRTLDELAAADARGAYTELVRWLWEMSADTGALSRLDPIAPTWRPFGCKPRKKLDDSDMVHYEGHGGRIRARSIVTHAQKKVGDHRSFFVIADFLLRHCLPDSLKNKVEEVDKLLEGGTVTLDADVHDGVVNSASMVWPDRDKSFAVDADHADVIGHFITDRDRHRYDLLPSAASFDEIVFHELWADIRDYM